MPSVRVRQRNRMASASKTFYLKALPEKKACLK